jgi:hypothetical protein
MIIIIAVVAIGILLNIGLNKKAGKKDKTGIIIMAASGVCANLFMLYRLHFESFLAFILSIASAAVLLLVIYLIAKIPGRLKARRAKPYVAAGTARAVIPGSPAFKKPRSILPGTPALRDGKNMVKSETTPRIPAKPNIAPSRRRIAQEAPETAVFKEGTLSDAAGKFGITDEPASKTSENQCAFTEEYEETTARAGDGTGGGQDGFFEMPARKDGQSGVEGTAFAGGQSEEILLGKVSSGANGQIEDSKMLQPLKEEAASESVKAAGDTAEEGSGVPGKAADVFGMQKEPPDENRAPKEESKERIRQKAIFKKAETLQSGGKYLIAYHLYEACAAETADTEIIKTAEIAMLDCLVAAGRYADAGKQLFGILNQKYELESEEKVKIKEYMELLHKRGRAE